MDRPAVVEVLDIDELMAVKAKSPGAARSDSPWNDPAIGFPAMCQKTAKRRLARSMPLNVMQQAARMDEAVDEQGAPAWISPDKGVVIDGEFSDAPTINHEQRGAAELLTPAPGIPTAADYWLQWDQRIRDATRPEHLAPWNADKQLHKQIAWTPSHSYEDLKAKVLAAVASMRAPA
jgi:hypothetical protein